MPRCAKSGSTLARVKNPCYAALTIILFLLLFPSITHAAPATQRAGGRLVQPEKRDVPGQKFAIGEGELYVPDFFKPGEKIDLAIWFLGAPWVVEQEFYEARKNAILFVASKQLMEANFPGPRHFDYLIGNIQIALKKKEITDKPIGKIALCSFSAGYSNVRQLLTFEEVRSRVSDLVLCDSLYAQHIAGPESELDDLQMKPFVEFAMLAAKGEKTFLFSQLYPTEAQYRRNTTTLTATYLIKAVGAKRIETKDRTSHGTPILYRADAKNFHVFGYAGMTNQDHFDHLYGMHDLLKRCSFENAKK
jgi:hypothetical protein